MEDRKAKTFIDVAKEVDKKIYVASDAFLLNYKAKWEKIDLALRLYSREFAPEIITELFEDWQSISDKIYFNNSFILTISPEGLILNTQARVEKMPKNVGEFVTIMSDNYSVYWKKEVFENYLKL